jgi:hypothetical protein
MVPDTGMEPVSTKTLYIVANQHQKASDAKISVSGQLAWVRVTL